MSRTIASLAVAALLFGCGGPQQQIKVEPSKPTKPGWITSIPNQPGYVHVVGVKSRAKTLEDGKAGAHQNATVQVSQFVGTSIASQAESRMSTEGPDTASEEVQAVTAAYIKSLVQVDEYYEKTTKMVGSYYEEAYDVWMLAKFPKSAGDEERKRQAVEQAEIGRDGLKRTEDARKELSSGNKREAWVLLSQSRKLLKSIPGPTELHEGGYDTAQDLLRAVEKELRTLDELARGVVVTFGAEDGGAKKVTPSFSSELAQALQKSSLILRDGGGARFVLTLTFSTKLKGKKVMGQTVGYLTYAGNVKDTWSGASMPGTSGEVKGFGKSPPAAFTEAAKEAATKIAKELSKNLIQALEKETNPEG